MPSYEYESGIFNEDLKFLQTLGDVAFDALSAGQAPVYNSTINKFENKHVTTTTSPISGTNGELVIVDTGGTGIEATTLGTIDATALTLSSSTLRLPTNTSALGGVSGSLSGTPNSTLAVDCNNVSYGFLRVQVPATSTLTTISVTNLRQSAQIIVHIEGTASGTLTIQGSDAGGISGCVQNFTADIEIANSQECLLTIFGSNSKVLVSAGKYI